jgi:regulator of replication initiation timing
MTKSNSHPIKEADMSKEARRIFPMETVLGVLTGTGGTEVLDLLGFALQRAVSDEYRPAVAPMVKGWLYSLHPPLMKLPCGENVAFNVWMSDQKKKLGDNVSITPIPASDLAGMEALFDAVENARLTAESKEAEAGEAKAAQDAAEAEAKKLAPFKKKAEDLEKKAAQLEEKNGVLAAEVKELKARLSAFDGKVAVAEADLEKSVKEIVSKAVKAALGGLVAAGGVAAAEGGADDTAAADAPEESGGVPDTFGFGASGANNDGFGF